MKQKQRITALLMAVCLLLTMLPIGGLPVFAVNGSLAGDGSQQNPYQIADAADLKAFRDKVNGGDNDACAILMDDIDLNPGIDFSDTGNYLISNPEQWTPIGWFYTIDHYLPYIGTFNGNGHAIQGMYINVSQSDNNQEFGLFSYLGSGGTVENLRLENSRVIAIGQNMTAGGLVGRVWGGTIQNCVNSANVTSYSGAGGIAAALDGGRVINCGNTATIGTRNSADIIGSAGGVIGVCNDYSEIANCYNTGSVSGRGGVGGIAGRLDYNSSATNCYNSGPIAEMSFSRDSEIGGVVGSLAYSSSLTNCYNVGSITATSSANGVGGVVGSVSYQSRIADCYYLDSCGAAGAGTAQTQSQMQSAEFVTALNDGNQTGIWQMDFDFLDYPPQYYNNGYPILNWQAPLSGGNGSSQNPILITNKEDLEEFRDLVNQNHTSLCGKLLADIDLNPGFTFHSDGSYTGEGTPEQWTAMEDYQGTFDGNGHVISGVYIPAGSGIQGLFRYVQSVSAQVLNLGVVNSYISGEQYVGGIAGYMRNATIQNCYSTAAVCTTAYGGNVGGIAGRAISTTIRNCYSTATVLGNAEGTYAGGIAGNMQNGGSLEYCYSTASVTGATAGMLAGTINYYEPSQNSRYYLDTGTPAFGSTSGSSNATATAVTIDQLVGTAAQSSLSLDFDTIWTAGPDSAWEYNGLDENGQAMYIRQGYLPQLSVFVSTQGHESVSLQTTSSDAMLTEDGYYLIFTADQLKDFRDIVNDTLEPDSIYTADASAKGRLMANIDLNPGFTFDENGYSGSGTPETWTPIGNSGRGYAGTFDGNGYVVSGVYMNNSASEEQGLFGCVSNGRVQNLGVVNSSISGGQYVGGVTGMLNDATLENCFSSAALSPRNGIAYAGGMAGRISGDSTVKSCYNTGAVSGTSAAYTGGVAGYVADSSSIQNCFNTGAMASGSSENSGGLVGYLADTAAVDHCYYLTSTAGRGVGSGNDTTTSLTAEQMTGASALTSMSFTSGWTAGAEISDWGYQETDTTATPPHGVYARTGGLPQLSVFTQRGQDNLTLAVTFAGLAQETGSDKRPYYLIYDADQLKTFRNIVNISGLDETEQVIYGYNAGANGKLMADIDLNPGITFGSDGTATGGIPAPWTPIGGADAYAGTFDGNGYTVSGVYIESGSNAGLFSNVNFNGTVQNLGVENSYIAAQSGSGAYAGGIAGQITGTIQNCYSTAAVWVELTSTTAQAYAGGIAGYVGDASNGGSVQNSYAMGPVTVSGSSTGAYAGGVIGYLENGDAANCFATGPVIASGSSTGVYTGGVAGGVSATADGLSGCYYLDTCGAGGGGNSITASQLAGPAAATNLTEFDFTDTWAVSNAESVWKYSGQGGDGNGVYTQYDQIPQLQVFVEKQGHFSLPTGTITGMAQQVGEDGKTYYLIYTADQLVDFRNITAGSAGEKQGIYSADPAANARLMANINLNPGYTFQSDGTYTYSGQTDAPGVREWNYTGNSNEYQGTFDGNGYTISGLYTNQASSSYLGLFSAIGNSGVVQDVGIINSYFRGYDYLGGIAGSNNGVISGCFFTGTVEAVDAYGEGTGGITGHLGGDAQIQNCYNTGTVRSPQDGVSGTGGIAGNAYPGDIISCLNVGTVSGGRMTGGILGSASGTTVTNCYYLDTCGAGGEKGTPISADQVTGSGALGNLAGFDPNIWTAAQDVADDSWTYSGVDPEDSRQGLYINGDMLPQLTVFTAHNIGHETIPGGISVAGLQQETGSDGKKYYLIYDADQLALFAKIVNGDASLDDTQKQIYTEGASANGKLAADIVLNENFDQDKFGLDSGNLTYDGGEVPDSFEQWTPIGSEGRPYTGTFDGDYHTVSGVYINAPSADYQGLFGCIRDTVQNMGVVNSYIRGYDFTAGVVADNHFGLVQNCYNAGTVNGHNTTAGVVGVTFGNVQNCYNTGTVTGYFYVGGVVARDSLTLTIQNCYNTGTVTGHDSTGGVAGYIYNIVQNCYNAGAVNGGSDTGSLVGYLNSSAESVTGYYLAVPGLNGVGDTMAEEVVDVTALTAEQMAGSNAKTNMSRFDFTNTWTADDSSTEWTYQGVSPDDEQLGTYAAIGSLPQLAVFAKNGHETIAQTTTGLQQETGSDGKKYYLIYDADQLTLFAKIVNGDASLDDTQKQIYPEGASANGKLMRDIVLNENFDQDKFALDSGNLTYDGGEVPDTFEQWTPIGSQGRPYTGSFDGDYHTVSGVYINNSNSADSGLFGFIAGGTVQNLGVINSYIQQNNYLGDGAGGIVGLIEASSSNRVKIINCFNEATVVGAVEYVNVGGIVGRAYYADIENCHNTGAVGAVSGIEDPSAGGVAGDIDYSTVTNCTNTGAVSAVSDGVGVDLGNCDVGGIVGKTEDSSITNCTNTGAVKGGEYANIGGVTGTLEDNGTVTNCTNTGAVSGGEGSEVGGVTGALEDNGTVTNCTNTGAVSGGEYANIGGVIGTLEDNGTVTNCYNTGAVGGGEDSDIGGVAGVIDYGGIVANCYNTGAVSGGEGSEVGGVVGNIYDGRATNCYYLEGSASTGIGDGSGQATSLSIAQIEDASENGLLASLVSGSGDGVWSAQLSAVGAWEYGKPAVQPILIWQTPIQNAPTYSVNIPEKATAGSEAVGISMTAGALRTNQQVEIAVAEDTDFNLYLDGVKPGDSIAYAVYAGQSETALKPGDVVLVYDSTAMGQTKQVSLTSQVTGTPKYSGTYTSTVTFTISVREVSGS